MSRWIVASFVFAITPSSVDEYPRDASLIASFHAARSPASNPSRKAFFLSFDMGRIRGDIRARGVKAFTRPGAGSADVPEILFRRCLRLGLRLPELRRDRVDLFRLRLELLEADVDAEGLREDGEDRLGALRVDEVPARLPHQADIPH